MRIPLVQFTDVASGTVKVTLQRAGVRLATATQRIDRCLELGLRPTIRGMGPISRGDAQAVLEAFGGGGWAILRHSDVARGAPADQVGSHGAIRPFDPWDGIRLHAEDWHVILIADFEGGDHSFSRQDAEQAIAQIAVRFELDGQELEITRTAIKRFLNPERFDLVEAYYAQFGRVMAPDELAVGEHSVRCTMTFGADVVFENTIAVTVR